MRNTIFLILFASLSTIPALAQQDTAGYYRKDFDVFWSAIRDEYSYFSKKRTDWEKVKQIFATQVDTVSSRNSFVHILEKALYELYDHHCNLNTNMPGSYQLVPTSADIWAEMIRGKAVITEVRARSGAESCGIRAGMEIVAIDHIPVQQAIQTLQPQSLKGHDDEADAFCLRLLLAGDHIHPRTISIRINDRIMEYFPDTGGKINEHIRYNGMLETKRFGETGYIRLNNCLYDNALITLFDSVMISMADTRGLILDLRETPSGGNTSVARAILGWFISQEHFYQKHEYPAEERQTGIRRSWVEIVSPRPGKYYGKPLVILVDHWTGSIAEGITIGFDAFRRPNTWIIGTTLARLNGAVYSYELPGSGIGFSFTAERLYHVNGKPREAFVPEILLDLTGMKTKENEDVFITAALRCLKLKR